MDVTMFQKRYEICSILYGVISQELVAGASRSRFKTETSVLSPISYLL